MERLQVLIPEIVANSGTEYLHERGYEVIDDRITTKQELIKKISDCDAMLIRIMTCDEEVLRAAKRIKVVSKHGVGVDNIDIEYCTEHGIQVTYTPLAVCGAVAEHALYLMFACAKNARYTVKYFVEGGDFDVRNKVSGVEIIGKTVGIIGLGRIGRTLAQICSGIGMNVIGYDPYLTQEQLGADIRLMGRDEVIKNADFVSMNLPCNKETRGMFGMREFEMMKDSAYLINVSRGGVVQEDALIEALQKKMIRGAGIDVYEKEPASPDNPLLHMENVFATPHQAGSTRETTAKVSLHAAIGIDEVLSGKKISWPLNNPKK